MKQFYFFLLALFTFSLGFGQYTGTGTFEKINSLAELTDGYYVILESNEAFAMNNVHNGTFLDRTSVTPSSNELINPSVGIVWLIETNGSGSTIYNEVTEEYVSYTGSSNNVQVVSSVSEDNQRWSITYSSNEFVFNNVAVSDRILQYNASSPRFACYTSNQRKFSLYKLSSVVIKPEPTNHPTAFTCPGGDSLTWTDATGTQEPDGYLIKWSDVSYADITNPIDGSTANGANSTTVSQGVESASITGLSPDTTYFYKIWPYTNSGADIDYKTNGTIQQTDCTTPTGPCLSQLNFTGLPTEWNATGVTFSSDEAVFESQNGELKTLAISNPTSLTFDLRRTTNTNPKSLFVEVSTTTQDGTYTLVDTYDHSNTTSGGITPITVDLTAYTSFSNVFIKLRKASSTTSPWYVKNFIVDCGVPSSDTQVQFASASGNAAENGGTFDLVLEITNEDAAATSVDVVLTSGNATDIDNYTTQTVTFPSSSAANQTVTLTITDNALSDGNRDLTFTLQNVSGGNNAQIGVQSTFVLTITDDELPTEGLQITSTNTAFIIDFDNTVSGVNNGPFNGSGFTPSPAIGQLDSNAWAVTGFSEGALAFGGSQTSGDFARGTSTGGVTTGGIYAFETSAGNVGLGFQATGSDFVPGTFNLKVQNQTGGTINEVDLSYIVYVYNDQARSNSFNFSYSLDDTDYTPIPILDLTSPEAADITPAWVSNHRSTSLTGLSIADGDFFYLRWTGDDVGGSGSRDEFALDDISVTFFLPPTVTFTYNTDSWSPSDPNGVSTLNDDIIIESGEATITSNTSIKTIVVNPGAALTVNTGVTLTVAEALTLESESDSYSSLILNGTIDGAVNYNRYTNVAGTGTSGGNDLVAPPLSGQTFGDFAEANAGVLSASGDVRAFAPFNNTASAYQNFSVTTNSDTPLEAGKGYRAATDAGAPLTFSGNVETGIVNVAITSETGTFGDWNLIGNPYPSYIDIEAFLSHEIEEDSNISLMKDASGIYGYDGVASDGWDLITLANAGSRLMAPGQGFFVAAGAAASLQFTPAMRVVGSGDDFIPGRAAPLTYLKLMASNGTNSYKTDIYFNANATAGLDPGYDAQIWGGQATGFTLYSHLVADNVGVPMGLQALGMDALNNVSIPLGINATAGSDLEFSILESQLPTSTLVYLEDTVNNTVTLINDSYAIINLNTNVNGTGRFFLRFTDNALSITNELDKRLNIYHQNTEQVIVIAGQLANNTQAYLYDLQGRVVSTTVLRASQTEQRVDVSNLSNGVYVLSFDNGAERISKKLIVP